jgi:hypothetical protein
MEQRKIAEVYFSAFLDIVTKQRVEYRPIFQSAAFAHDWLPDTYYVNNFREQDTYWLMNFEEDGDPATGTAKELTVTTSNLSRWNEAWIQLKWNPLDTFATRIAWDNAYKENARFEMNLTEPLIRSDYDSLVFSVSQGSGGTMPRNFEADDAQENTEDMQNPGEAGAEKEDDQHAQEPTTLDWSIVIVDRHGEESRINLSKIEPLYPQVKQDTLKAQFSYQDDQSEVVLKYYAFTLDEFTVESDGTIAQIRFDFDQSSKGNIVLDDVGLTRHRGVSKPLLGSN